MTLFLQLCFSGIALGCIYALIALGFSIIFKASQVINFAQGEFLLVGAFLTSIGISRWHLNFFVALLLALAITVGIGLLFERFALRRMVGKPVFAILMVTIGLDTLLRTGVIVNQQTEFQSSPSPFEITSGFDVGGLHFGAVDLSTIIVTVLLCVGLYFFFNFTRYGLAMRATALDQEAALALGINIRLVYALAWGIAAAVATLGGVLLADTSATFDVTLGSSALQLFWAGWIQLPGRWLVG